MITWKDFAFNEWKSIVRSPLAGQTIGIKILWAIIITLVVGLVSAVGMNLPVILRNGMADRNPVIMVNGVLWRFFLGDLIIKIVMLNIPASIIHQYLHCNISRNKIVGYLMVKSIFNLPNVVGVGLWLSFGLSTFGFTFAGVLWFSGIIILLNINTMLVLLIASFRKLLFSILIVGLVFAVIGVLEFIKISFMSAGITFLFSNLAEGYYLPIIAPFLLLVGIIRLVHRKIFSQMFIDQSFVSKTKGHFDTSKFVSISNLRFEWLLVYRNKRLRNMILLMYGWIGPSFLYQLVNSNTNSANPYSAIMPYFILSVYFLLLSALWGQLAFISESTFIDRIATLPQHWKRLLRRKHFINLGILTVGGTIAAIVEVIYLDVKIVLQIFSLYIFHCGTTVFLVLYRSTLHRQRFEINTSAWFNYQGSTFSFMDIVIILLGLIAPILYYALLKNNVPQYINPILITIGIVNLCFYKQWMAFIQTSFMKRRYSMLEGFRTVL